MKSEEVLQNHIDFEELGLNNLWLRCGKSNHLANDCQINRNNLNCKACNLSGYVQKVCIETLLNSEISNNPKIETSHIETYENTTVNTIVDIYDDSLPDSSADAKKYCITVKIENSY